MKNYQIINVLWNYILTGNDGYKDLSSYMLMEFCTKEIGVKDLITIRKIRDEIHKIYMENDGLDIKEHERYSILQTILHTISHTIFNREGLK
ncbi:MAG: hypothetical protein ACOCP4_03830 [Candidatus Woesearchaeota archaeon]|uniref:Uncharacterized protein n=1 Tax=Arfiviricetes sp. TaxID=2832556 RepID=A0AB39A3D6_9VIRU